MFHVKPKPETKIPLQQCNYLPPTNPSKYTSIRPTVSRETCYPLWCIVKQKTVFHVKHWSLFSRWENLSTRTSRKSERTCYLAWSSLLTETSHVWGSWISFTNYPQTHDEPQVSINYVALPRWFHVKHDRMVQPWSLFRSWENLSTLTSGKSERINHLACFSLLTETSHVWGRWISFLEAYSGVFK